MATNCIPTIQNNGVETNKKLATQTEILEKHTEILTDISTNLKILVDRGTRL